MYHLLVWESALGNYRGPSSRCISAILNRPKVAANMDRDASDTTASIMNSAPISTGTDSKHNGIDMRTKMEAETASDVHLDQDQTEPQDTQNSMGELESVGMHSSTGVEEEQGAQSRVT